MNYWQIIHRYIPPDSAAYGLYTIHVSLVTAKALRLARKLNLKPVQLQFIEEASMLHDIGICRVDDPQIYCHGELPYISHVTEGAKILRHHGLEKHAQVAETHTGVGMLATDIKTRNIPIPARDYIPQTIEEEIISWADLFYTKLPDKLWQEKSLPEVKESIVIYGTWYQQRFEEMKNQFTQA